jgi:hypothetical protein
MLPAKLILHHTPPAGYTFLGNSKDSKCLSTTVGRTGTPRMWVTDHLRWQGVVLLVDMTMAETTLFDAL